MTELAQLKLYSAEDVSKFLGITKWTYNQMCIKKIIPAKKVGRNWMITEEKLKEYLNKR